MRKKKIAIIVRGLERGGVERYLTELLESLHKKKLGNIELVLITDERKLAKQFPKFSCVYLPAFHKLIWDYFFSPVALALQKVDAVLYTKNIIPFTHTLFSWQKVVVVYDLGFMYPELRAYTYLDTLYMKLFLGISLRIADTVVTISEFTLAEIKKFYPWFNTKKAQAIHLGVSDSYFSKVTTDQKQAFLEKYHIKMPFIFYCGSLSPRKNIVTALKAFKKIHNKIDHHFYLVSGKSWNDELIQAKIQDSKQLRIEVLDFMPERDLITMYALADALVYISKYEGFGLPVIEAQAVGCPVVMSNSPLYKEVAKLQAVAVDPFDIDSVANGIYEAVIKQKKRKITRPLSWDKVAEFYLDVLCK